MEESISTLKWNYEFWRSLASIMASEGTDRHKLLGHLDKYVKVDSFVYEDAEAERLGKQCLLDLWIMLLTFANPEYIPELEALKQSKGKRGKINARPYVPESVKVRLVRKAYFLIPFLVKRREFDLIHLYPPANPPPASRQSEVFKTKLAADETLAIVQRYRRYLLLTLQFAFTALQVPRGWHRQLIPSASENAQRQLQDRLRDLTIHCLVMAFFTIPLLCGPLVTVLADVAPTAAYVPDEDEKGPKVGIGLGAGRNSPSWLRHLSNDVRDWVNFVTERRAQSHKTISASDKGNKKIFLATNPGFFEWTRPELTQHNMQGDSALITPEAIECIRDLFTDMRTFFPFVYHWLRHVTSATIGVIQWSCVPGYWLVVQCFLNRFMMEDVRYLGDESVRGSANLILRNRYCNACLNFFTRAMLNITNLYNKEDFNFSMDVLDSWLSIVDGTSTPLPEAVASEINMATPIPETFCYDVFFEVMKVLLSYDHFQIVLKTLAFLYMHADRFYGKQRRKLWELIMGKDLFSSLLLHWHPEVRHMFMYFMVYRICRRGKAPFKFKGETALTAELKRGMLPGDITLSTASMPPISAEDEGAGAGSTEEKKKEEASEKASKSPPADGKPAAKIGFFRKMSNRLTGIFKDSQFGETPPDEKHAGEEEAAKGDNRHILVEDEDPSFEACVLVVSYLSKEDLILENELRNRFKTFLEMCVEQTNDPTLNLLEAKHRPYIGAMLLEYEKITPSFSRLQQVHDDPSKRDLVRGRGRNRSRSAHDLTSMLEGAKGPTDSWTSGHKGESRRRGRSVSPEKKDKMDPHSAPPTATLQSLIDNRSNANLVRGQVFLPTFHYQILSEKS